MSVEELIGDVNNDISKILKKYSELNIKKKELETAEDILKTKIKVFMKEKQWERYLDTDTKMSITISTMTRKTINEDLLKKLLTDQQMAQVTTTTSFEKMMIMTADAREKLKKILK